VLRGNPDLGATNRYGGVALIPAGERGHVAMVRALLDSGADPAIADGDGVTALEHARERGYGEMVTMLERAGEG
jgi:hypothetical protein